MRMEQKVVDLTLKVRVGLAVVVEVAQVLLARNERSLA